MDIPCFPLEGIKYIITSKGDANANEKIKTLALELLKIASKTSNSIIHQGTANMIHALLCTN